MPRCAACPQPPAPPTDCAADLLALLRSPGWVYRQYDHQLFLNTVVGPGADAALLRLAGPGLPPSDRGVALTTDSNPRACALDPRRGPALVLAEGVANLACVGATPAAVVNCLNFGNPEHPEVMWQLSECIDGMAESCRALALPIIGGNVSFYNESGGSDIDPTPVLGVLGLVDAVHAPPPGLAWSAGDTHRAGRAHGEAADGSFPLEGTRWATERRDHRTGQIPSVDFAAHGAACAFVAGLVAAQVAGSDGGAAGARRPRRVERGTGRGAGRDGRRGGDRVHAGPRGTPPSSSPSCPRASSWRRPIPTSCADGPRPAGSRPPCWVRRAAPGAPWAAWSTFPSTPCARPTRGTSLWPWANRDATGLCENG